MTKRQPKGTPVGGQFAQDRKPSGRDLSEVKVADTEDKFSDSVIKIVSDGLPSDNGYIGGSTSNGTVNRETGTFNFDDHTYQFEKIGPKDGVTTYHLTNADGGGGWDLKYDGLTRRASAHGRRPINPSEEWRDKGEADIRTVARLFEPNVKLLDLDGNTYLIGGSPQPLSESHLSGVSFGQGMLVSGKFDEAGLREYVAPQRVDIDRRESRRPDMAKSFDETRRFLDGIEIAADIGAEAAKANTAGAMEARFGGQHQ